MGTDEALNNEETPEFITRTQGGLFHKTSNLHLCFVSHFFRRCFKSLLIEFQQLSVADISSVTEFDILFMS